jgi:mannose-6-phosphate isomerase
MGDLLGDAVFDRFGSEFPLLVKFIDAADFLSVQVHPDDELARERHNSSGKTEMWYIVGSDNGQLITGFNSPVEREQYLQHLERGTLGEILNRVPVAPGDIFYMPAGRIHAIGPGVLLAEIQQTSDVTYRIYDWDRTGEDGQPRELHTELALDAIDFEFHPGYRTDYRPLLNRTVTTVDCPWFTTGVIRLDRPVEKDFNLIDSFVIYLCTEGAAGITYHQGAVEMIKKGETLLIPAELKNLAIIPAGPTTLLEVYIK